MISIVVVLVHSGGDQFLLALLRFGFNRGGWKAHHDQFLLALLRKLLLVLLARIVRSGLPEKVRIAHGGGSVVSGAPKSCRYAFLLLFG